jgi:hypothetical protein
MLNIDAGGVQSRKIIDRLSSPPNRPGRRLPAVVRAPMMPFTNLAVRVARKHVEAEDICSLELVAHDAAPLPAFSAGSHVDVQLPARRTDAPYSLCNDPTRRTAT